MYGQKPPFRDQVLAKVLMSSMAGKSRLNLILWCSPSGLYRAEGISTLRFGLQALNLKVRLAKETVASSANELEAVGEEMRSRIRDVQSERDSLLRRIADQEEAKATGAFFPQLLDDTLDPNLSADDPEHFVLLQQQYNALVAERDGGSDDPSPAQRIKGLERELAQMNKHNANGHDGADSQMHQEELRKRTALGKESAEEVVRLRNELSEMQRRMKL